MVTTLLSLSTGGATSCSFFAREPEPEFELEEMDAPDRKRSGTSGASQKPPRSNTVVLLLLLIVVAAGAYCAMNPEFVMNLLGEGPFPVSVPGPAEPAPRSATQPRTQPTGPGPAGGQPSSPAEIVPSPLFGEGQHASVNGNPTAPASHITLTADSAGSQPAQTVRPGDVVIVLDAEWLGNTWIYLVRTQDGAKGWISESHLRGAL